MATNKDTPVVNFENITMRRPTHATIKSRHNSETKDEILSIDMNSEVLKDTPVWGRLIIQLLNTSLKSLDSKIIEACDIISEYTESIETISGTATEALTTAAINKADISKLSDRVDMLTDELSKSNAENEKLKEHILKNESYSRRENLVFRGFQPSTSSCQQIIKNIIGLMNIPNFNHQDIPFVRCHYLDRTKSQIIVRFLMYSDREMVWMNRRNLRDTANNVYISEDYPVEIEQRRKDLYPIASAANRIPEFRRKVRVSADKLVVNSKTYTVTSLHTLPALLQPMKLSERSSDTLLVVGGVTSKHHPLSNFYRRAFTLDGITFSHSEQAYQYLKAILFGDMAAARLILDASDPARMRYLGKHVRGFDYNVWNKKQDDIMKRVLFAKFSQHDDLSKLLLDTGTKTLAEANSRDSYWAIGLPITSPNVLNKASWARNGNKLGQLLMSLRQQLAR